MPCQAKNYELLQSGEPWRGELWKVTQDGFERYYIDPVLCGKITPLWEN